MNADFPNGLINQINSQENSATPKASAASLKPPHREVGLQHWPIILVEFIHLLGLFLIHTRHAKSARATTVFFEQLVRHLNLLAKLPGHDGAMIIRRIRERGKENVSHPNYLILFGNITLRGDSTWDEARYGQSRISQFGSALQQAFASLDEQGIHAMFLKLPEQSAEQIERLRLSLNIIARFQQAAESATPITFRYYGRTLTIPLIRDRSGQGDINLTLMAGLNNLSAANTMEMIKQADAYSRLGPSGNATSQTVNWYNQIFCEPRLRRHLVWPPVEVNNLPWADPVTDFAEEIITLRDVVSQTDDDKMQHPETCLITSRTTVDRAFLHKHLKGAGQKIMAAVDILLTEDYPVLNPRQLGVRLGAISYVLEALEARSVEPAVLESLMAYLNARLEWVPDSVLSFLHIQQKGLRIGSGSNALLVGMVHPRLLDLVNLIKERLATRLKMKAVQFLTLGFKQNETANLEARFDVGSSDATRIVGLLQHCFDDQGHFHIDQFELQIKQFQPYGATVFDMLWCLFKQTAGRKGRGDLIQAIVFLMKRLDDTKHPLQILLSDIFQNPFEVKHMDRNAIVLANGLLHGDFQTLQIHINQISEAVFNDTQGIDPQVRQYAASRLDLEQTRIRTKLRTICELLHTPIGQINQGQHILFDHSFLTALEREIFILLSLVGGKTSRNILREALERYSQLLKESIGVQSGESGERPAPYTSMAVDQMTGVIRALGRIGRPSDVDTLQQFKYRIGQFEGEEGLETVKDFIPNLMKELSYAIKAIQDGKK